MVKLRPALNEIVKGCIVEITYSKRVFSGVLKDLIADCGGPELCISGDCSQGSPTYPSRSGPEFECTPP
jgi:hypothetical protein